MKDYSSHLFRVSSLGHIMAGATFGKDKWEASYNKQLDLLDKYNRYDKEYEAINNKETKTAMSKLDQAENARDAFYLQRTLTLSLERDKEKADISEGCRTHLTDVWIANEFGRATKDIRSKYIEKGIMMEDTGMIQYGIVKGWIPEKCMERKDDGFIMGEIDFTRTDTIYDNKCSWDIWTFYKNIKYLDCPESNPYFWNMQGYMRLWDKPKSKVVYTLVDTPAKLIENEKKRIQYDFTGSEEMLVEALAEVEKNLTYSDISIDRRVIEIPINRDENAIAQIPIVVKACRDYLNNMKTIYYEQETI